MLQLLNISKCFSGIPAVDDVSFEVPPGSVTGYLGPNGSGKSTTLKIIAGLLEPTAGVVLFNGSDVSSDMPGFRRGLGLVPEEPHLYTHLTGLEYLEMVAQLRELPLRATRGRIEDFLALLSLANDRHAPISGYSKGMRQKILLVAALLHNPDLILLDEPFSGLDVTTSLVLRGLIQHLGRRGKTVLFSCHELDIVEKVCSRVVILHKGKVVANDSIAALRSLLSAPSLEAVFAQLATNVDLESVSTVLADLVSQP
jgi:ABC-2 type transport system ATP-binding protein